MVYYRAVADPEAALANHIHAGAADALRANVNRHAKEVGGHRAVAGAFVGVLLALLALPAVRGLADVSVSDDKLTVLAAAASRGVRNTRRRFPC